MIIFLRYHSVRTNVLCAKIFVRHSNSHNQEVTMQNDTMMRLIQRVTEDADFRANALLNLEDTLQAEGFSLSSDELSAVQAFQTQILGNAGIELGELTNLQYICGQ